jgi:tetratricopeptide (TPR) repeat protein
MAERLAYAPSILFCALAGIAAWELRPAGPRIAAAAAVACLWLAIERNETWSDDLTLAREQVRTSPRSAKAHVNLASALGNAGDDRGALAAYERALEILPGYPGAEYQRGNALHRLGADPELVVGAYRRAIQFEPSDVRAHVNLAWTLFDTGRADEARRVVAEIRRLDPRHPMLPKLEQRSSERGSAASK